MGIESTDVWQNIFQNKSSRYLCIGTFRFDAVRLQWANFLNFLWHCAAVKEDKVENDVLFSCLRPPTTSNSPHSHSALFSPRLILIKHTYPRHKSLIASEVKTLTSERIIESILLLLDITAHQICSPSCTQHQLLEILSTSHVLVPSTPRKQNTFTSQLHLTSHKYAQ